MIKPLPVRAATAPVALFVVFAAIAGSGVARAQPRAKVLVLPFEGELPASAPADGLAKLTAVVARSAGLTGAEVSTGQASFTDTADLMGCGAVAAECFAKIAAGLEVDQVVTGTVKRSDDGGAVTVSLRFFKDDKVHEKSLEILAPSFQAVLDGLARDVPDLFVGAAPGPKPEPGPRPDPEPGPKPATASPQPVPPRALAPPPSVERDRGFDAGRVGVIAWTVTGVGAAAAVAGGVSLFLARDRQQKVDDAPTASVADLDRLEQLEDEGERLTLIGDGLLIGGGAALLVGGALVVYQGLWARDGGERSSLAIAPVPLPGGVGVNLSIEAP